jgi:hypothetical protein
MYSCPVCGYDGLRRQPADHLICPSCGTQFGYSDAGDRSLADIYASLREGWIAAGAKWHSKVTPAPFLWNPWQQLRLIEYYKFPWMENLQVTETVQYVSVGTLYNQPQWAPWELA